MRVIRDKIDGPLDVSEATVLHGMITGNVTVLPNILLELHGMVLGDLILETDSVATVYGMVKGSIFNRGGKLEVFGWVGALHRLGGTTTVHPDARVGPSQPENHGVT